jgi:hypothetical protein
LPYVEQKALKLSDVRILVFVKLPPQDIRDPLTSAERVDFSDERVDTFGVHMSPVNDGVGERMVAHLSVWHAMFRVRPPNAPNEPRATA